MNNSKNLSTHYWTLTGVIVLGAILRFWHLDLKPLWLDEVLTALLSLGRLYVDVPLDVVFPLSTLQQLFILKPDVSCPEIAQAVASQSTHPPLFFCLMHQWLSWLEPVTQSLSWKLRALPALSGVCAIASIYCLNRIVFSPAAGLMGAALMAVSPFGVYLSQEARHYTLPVLLTTLALLGFVQIQQTLYSQKLPRPRVWVAWGIVNSLGCYVHYFFILAFIAQLLTLIGVMLHRRRLPKGSWVALGLVVVGVAVSYLPWLPVLFADFGRPETGWLPTPEHIMPLIQTLVGWVLMVIALPIEGQPLWIQVPMALLMLGFTSWFGWQSWRGFKQLWRQPETHVATLALSCFTVCVLLQFFAIVYLLGKDITVAPRYNFVYYPAITALLGASLAVNTGKIGQWKKILPLSLGLLSCVFVVSNLVFLKPFNPQQIAQDMNLKPVVPMMIAMGYNNFQDVALGLSVALAVEKGNPGVAEEREDTSFVFLNSKLGYDLVWQKLSKLPALPLGRMNLWVIAPGLRRRDYPQQLTIGSAEPAVGIANQIPCTRDPSEYYRLGVPYQLYRCQKGASP